MFDDFQARHPNHQAGQIAQRLPGAAARFVEGRERPIASLRELGLR